MVGTFLLEQQKVVDCVEVVLLQEVGCVIVMGVWWNVVEVMVCPSGVIVALLVDFRWSVKISWGMAVLEQQYCCGSVLAPLFQPSFWFIEYVKCRL